MHFLLPLGLIVNMCVRALHSSDGLWNVMWKMVDVNTLTYTSTMYVPSSRAYGPPAHACARAEERDRPGDSGMLHRTTSY